MFKRFVLRTHITEPIPGAIRMGENRVYCRGCCGNAHRLSKLSVLFVPIHNHTISYPLMESGIKSGSNYKQQPNSTHSYLIQLGAKLAFALVDNVDTINWSFEEIILKHLTCAITLKILTSWHFQTQYQIGILLCLPPFTSCVWQLSDKARWPYIILDTSHVMSTLLMLQTHTLQSGKICPRFFLLQHSLQRENHTVLQAVSGSFHLMKKDFVK